MNHDDDGWVEIDLSDDDDQNVDGPLEDDSSFPEFNLDDLNPADDLFQENRDANLPVVAVIGRPNVGKSTLVNRIIGERAAVVEDVPGVTRDRVTYSAEWNGRRFNLVDTGGWEQKARGMQAQIAAQAERAAADADVVMLVVDTEVGVTDTDEAIVNVLRRAGRPIILVANKSDDAATELQASDLWSLGLGEPQPVSALHGRGSGDLLDRLVAALPEQGKGLPRDSGPTRVALIGRPNTGKSSLLNALAGSDRAVVDAKAGTTVDPVDELITIGERTWWFVDTAGIRRRSHQASGSEYYATLRTEAALDRAQLGVVLLDASEPLSEQDVRLISMVVEAGRGLVIAMNKWDLVDEDRRNYLEREIDRDLANVAWAPRVNISARTGRHIARLEAALIEVEEGWRTRISTGRLNAFLAELEQAHPHPVRGGRQPRILYGAQVASGPPTFVLFVTGFLEAGYRRFIERRLREDFGFVGSPIRLQMRMRTRRTRS
ncbi:MAG: ribosome biogenesis GTPase Der [Actinomycetales bacterium]|nr:ribosome biogenesis GTPase Der [Actinomycetales bacterium]